jgi:hypothetical protein
VDQQWARPTGVLWSLFNFSKELHFTKTERPSHAVKSPTTLQRSGEVSTNTIHYHSTIILFCHHPIDRPTARYDSMILTCASNRKKAGRMVFFLFAISAIVVFLSYGSVNITTSTLPVLPDHDASSASKLPNTRIQEKSPVPVDAASRLPERIKEEASFIFIPSHPSETNVTKVEDAIVLHEGSDEASPLATCNPTAQVRIAFTKPKWTLTTLDKDGNIKYMGGDEFYIVYYKNVDRATAVSHNPPEPTAVAFCHDHGDGNYTLDFSTTPMNPINATILLAAKNEEDIVGSLVVYFDYTCNIGRVPLPRKRLWKNRGSTSTVHAANIAQQQPPNIRIFQLPPKPIAIQNLSSFASVNFVGASTMRNVVRKNRTHNFESNAHYYEIKMPLSTATVKLFISRLTMMRERSNGAADTAIVMGSDIWDVLLCDEKQGSGFEDHLQACTRLVEAARRLYPNATLLWKSPTAMHLLRLPPAFNYPVGFYMSNARSKFLNDAQRDLMVNQLHVPFLDLWETTYLSAFHTDRGDGRHYSYAFNKQFLSDYLFHY